MEPTILETITDALEDIEAQGSFCARQVAAVDHLHIEVKELGALRFPLKSRQIKGLIKQAQPAKFGWRDQTKLDRNVRDVWEIPKRRLKIDNRRWNKTLKPMLEQLKSALGLANQDSLKAELHNLLIYEPGQFFQPHQDSEKSDGMVATLVVVLPSSYRGGTLIVDHQGEKQRFPSTKTPADKLTFIAFYADCHHEVRPVTEGYRIALTYNLVLGVANNAVETPVADQSDSTVTQAVENYFDTAFDPRPEYNKGRPELRKLIYLLDHEYTPKGLSWQSLKSVDRARAQALMGAAEALGLEIHLGLADIHETWACEEEYDDWGYAGRDYREYDDEDEDDDEDETSTEDGITLTELVDDEILIRHWVNEADKAVQLSDLFASSWQVCWTKPTDDFQPFETDYEGWMGNYGNTMERWYHRAAIVLWRQTDHYAILLKFNSDKVMTEVLRLTQKSSTLPQAQKIVHDIIPNWSGLSARAKPAAFSRVLKLAAKLNQAKLAAELLIPLDVKALCPETVDALMLLEQSYGEKWCLDILQKWVSPQPKAFIDSAQRLEKLSKIIEKLTIKYATRHQKFSQWMLAHQIQALKDEHIAETEDMQLAELRQTVSQRMPEMIDLLRASLLALDKKTHNATLDFLMANEALYPVLELVGVLQQFQQDYQRPEVSRWHHRKLYQFVMNQLTAEIKRGPRQADNWSIMDKNTCDCDDCKELNTFLQDRDLTQKIWPLNQERRSHIHEVITGMDLPVTLQTKHTGSPHKLVLNKTQQLFIQDKANQKKYKQAQAKLAKLAI